MTRRTSTLLSARKPSNAAATSTMSGLSVGATAQQRRIRSATSAGQWAGICSRWPCAVSETGQQCVSSQHR